MNKQINYELTKEDDGVKANINVIGESIVASVTFKSLPYYPFALNEENLKEMKSEITKLLSKVNEIKKEEKRKSKPVRRILRKQNK
jgi:hypothetical protein